MAENESEQKRLLKEAVGELLTDPALLYRLKKELDRFIIGENENKVTLYLICASSHTKFNLSAVITGTSSSGKSWLKAKVLQYFGNVRSYTRITAAAPDRLGSSLTNQILDIEELRGSEAAQPTLRVAISEGKLCLLSTTRDENGKIVTEEIKTEGTPTFVTTCTTDVDDELLNRLFIISIDETKEHTKEIIQFEAKRYHLLGGDSDDDAEKPDVLFSEMIKELLPITRVEIPYLTFLAEKFPQPSGREQSCGPRRDFKKLVYLIGVVAWLHQKQRTIIGKTGVLNRAVLASPIDFQLVWSLCKDSFLATLNRLTRRHEEVLACFKVAVPLTVADVAAELKYSENRAREFLRGLVRRGYLSEDRSQKTHKYMLKQEKTQDSSIDEFVASLTSFEEKTLEERLNDQNYKILFRPLGPPKAINPVTGEPLAPPNRILSQDPTEPKEGTKPSIVTSDSTKTSIVPLSSFVEKTPPLADLKVLCEACIQRHTIKFEDIKDVGCVDEFGLHFCCLCGTFSETSWRALLVDGRQLPLCETCREECQSLEIKVDNRCERELPLSGSPQNGT